MRCPKCTERNSVASRKCEFCGERFKRKPIPMGLKLAAGGIAIAVTASIAASYVVPRLVDPEQSLSRVAKHMAAGPSSPEDAKRIKKDFNEAMKAYLKNAGSSKSVELTHSLQKVLPSTAYEVHVVDLQRGLKIVEVDAILQACEFLVMKTNSGIKVFDLPGFEVFDDGRILNDSAGPVLALVGHTGGPPPHHPQVRTYALLPDYISDETEKLVPPLMGDGSARFDSNDQDIKLELSKLANMNVKPVGRSAKANKDENIHGMLRWREAHYVADYGRAASALAQKPDKNTIVQPAAASVVASIEPVHPSKSVAPKIIVRELQNPTTAGSPIAAVKPQTQPQPAVRPQVESGAALAAVPMVPPVVPAVPTAASTATHSRKHRHGVENTEPTATTAITSSKHSGRNSRNETSSSRTGFIAGSGVTVRAAAGRGAGSLGALGHGESVTILGEHDGWYRIRYQGQDAYVYSNLVQSRKPKDVPETIAATTPQPTRSGRHHHRHSSVAEAAPVVQHTTTVHNTPVVAHNNSGNNSATGSGTTSSSGSTKSRKTRVKLASTTPVRLPGATAGGHEKHPSVMEPPNLVP